MKKSFRNKSISEVLESGVGGRVAGRVLGISEDIGIGNIEGKVLGFYLQDASNRVEVICDQKVKVGDLVEIEVLVEGGRLRCVSEVLVLVESEGFEVGFESENYKKILIDWELREILLKRSELIDEIRVFFKDEGFLEVDTPLMVELPGMEPYLDVFKTRFVHSNTMPKDIRGGEKNMYLITSPEYAMKKLLVGGLEKIFQICKVFRNKEVGGKFHNPEFTMIEWYRAFSDYEVIMNDVERLVKNLWRKFGVGKMVVDGREIEVMEKWRKMKVVDAFKYFAGIEIEVFEDLNKFKNVVKQKGYFVNENEKFDELFFKVFLNEIEPKLGYPVPVILYEYPVSMAALSRKCDNEKYAERFEVYVGGVELCNGFTELNDYREQFERLKNEREERIVLGKDVYDVDMSFIEALKLGMPPSGGVALGVDRLIMLILGQRDIQRVMFFPWK